MVLISGCVSGRGACALWERAMFIVR